MSKYTYIRRFVVILVFPLCLVIFGYTHHFVHRKGSSSTTSQKDNTTVIVTATPESTILNSEMPTLAPTQTPTPTPTPSAMPTKAPTPTPAPPSFETPKERKKYYIEVSLAAQIVYIYDIDEVGNKGALAKAILCSTGKADSPTPLGKWIILDNGMEHLVENAWGASRYQFEYLSGISYGQYMSRLWKVESNEHGEESFGPSDFLFHSAPYYAIDKNRLMTEEWNKLGTPASAGCIRMNASDAKWIYDYVAAYSYVYTIEGTPDPELWAALKLANLPLNVTKDPTDTF